MYFANIDRMYIYISIFHLFLLVNSQLVNTFFNDGRMRGWDRKHAEADGELDEVENDCFDNGGNTDTHCLYFSQRYNPDYRGRYHSEVILFNASQHGKSNYYGFAFKLSKNWKFDENPHTAFDRNLHRVAIMQFITSMKDLDCGKVAVPTTMLWVYQGYVYTKLRTGHPCIDAGNIKEFKIGAVTPGKWHTIVLGILWHKEKKGWFKVWLDKKLRIDETWVKTFPKNIDNKLFEFRVGIYPNWYSYTGKGHPIISDKKQRLKEIYIDTIGIGPSFTDADPWYTNRGGELQGYKKDIYPMDYNFSSRNL